MKMVLGLSGGSQEDAFACASEIAVRLSGEGRRVGYIGPWNRSGDPDPYHSHPFCGMALVSPEAVLLYRRPGGDTDGLHGAIEADLVLVAPSPPGSGAIILGAGAGPAAGLASWGFDAPGLPDLSSLDGEGLSDFLDGLRAGTAHGGTACSGGCGQGLTLTCGGRDIPLSRYPERVLSAVVRAVLSTLHGVDGAEEIVIRMPGNGGSPD